MRFRYCETCEKETPHQRALGIGTLLAVLITCGLWTLALPFYPQRCRICATPKYGFVDWPHLFPKHYDRQNLLIGYGVLIGLALLIVALGLIFQSGQPRIYQPPLRKPAAPPSIPQPAPEPKIVIPPPPGVPAAAFIENTAAFQNMTPAQHIQEAKDDLAVRSSSWPHGLLNSATRHLQAIPPDASEYPEAQRLLAEVKRRRSLQK
jgi:hypothetical protein